VHARDTLIRPDLAVCNHYRIVCSISSGTHDQTSSAAFARNWDDDDIDTGITGPDNELGS
jgi:hypothetical protein